MRLFRDAPIKQKLTAVMMLSCVIVLLLASLVFAVVEIQSFRHALYDKTVSLSQILATNTVIPLVFKDKVAAEKTLASLSAEPHIRQAYLFDAKGEPFARYRGVDAADEAIPITCDRLPLKVHSAELQCCFTLKHLAVFKPIYHRGERIGLIYLLTDLDEIYARFSGYAIGALLLLGGFTVFTYLLSSRLQKVISAPILHLAERMKEVSERRDFLVRAECSADDEIGQLVGGFNEMLSHLEARDRQLQEYWQELEEKVEERTAELRAAHAELSITVSDLEEARREAEVASEAKSSFLATMSHEIRTPMIGVLGMTELLAGSGLDERQRGMAETANRSGQALLSLLDDILDFSKIEAGRLELETADFDLPRLVEEVICLYAPKSRDKGLELVCRMVPSFPRIWRGDSARLRQVLQNLVGNALKFTERGEVVVTVASADQGVRFEVRDTGIGIPIEVQEEVFERFTQGDSATTRNFGGTGLGLTIVRELVGLMGGRVDLQSAPGNGTCLCLRIPMERPLSAEDPQVLLPELQPGLRLLVASANAAVCAALAEQLADLQLEVDVAGNGVETLAMTKRASREGRPYRLLLLDDVLPGSGGQGLIETLRRDPQLGAPGLLLLGAPESPSGPLSLAKPVLPSAVAAAVVSALAADGSASVPASAACATAGDVTRILVAEDNPDVQQLVQMHLELLGCQVGLVANGAEAVARLAHERFDLVLMDHNMPEMDGPEATRRIRARGDRTPIVALTAHTSKEYADAFAAAGVDDYLCKPFRQEELMQLLDRWHPVAS